MNVADLMVRSATEAPHRPALHLGETTLDYGTVNRLSAAIAARLIKGGLTPGDRVGVMLPNVLEFPVIYYGVLRAGGVVVPMNPLLKRREIDYYLSDSGARWLFAWHLAADEAVSAEKLVTVDPTSFLTDLAIDLDDSQSENPTGVDPTAVLDRDGGDTAVILYTSGTTGHPKGAELTHSNLTRNAEVSQTDLLQLEPDDVVFGGLPLFHSFGQTCTLNAGLSAGASLVLLPRFDAGQAAALVAERGVTVFAGVPTMYSALLHLPDAPAAPALRVCISGGAALPVEVLYQFEKRFGAPVLEGYGLSETSPVASFNQPGRPRKPGSIGTPLSGIEMRVVDSENAPLPQGEIGEIAIRGHNIMKGYWNKPEATEAVLGEDGWFRTGDIGRTDEEGYYFIVDRKKDLIIRGGFNIYPREIEEVLYEHPAVAEAGVIGIPHEDLGEEVGAAIALKPGAQADEAELRDFVKAQVAPYKYPRVVWFVDALPKGPTGKIVKREIIPPAPGGN